MSDVHLLKLALGEARKHRGSSAPNPAVGAVVVREGRLMAVGSHRGAGQPHAEVEALRHLSAEESRGATIYVTLEPCCHWGRTPPCSRLLIERGISRVVYGFRDPNPKVSGQGHAECAGAGLEVTHLPLAEIDRFYESYAAWTTTGRPFVTAKLALSLDGKFASFEGPRLQITAEEAARLTHELRAEADALLSTQRTVVADDPELNVRLQKVPVAKPLYLLDRHALLSPEARVWRTASHVTVFCGPDAPEERRGNLEAKGARVVVVPAEGRRLSVAAILEAIGQDGVHDLWIEAGATLFESMAVGGYLDRAFLYVAPRWLGPGRRSAFQSGGWCDSAKRVFWRAEGRDAVCVLEW